MIKCSSGSGSSAHSVVVNFGTYNIRDDEIELISPISEGEQGKVWKGRCRGFDVAVKIPKYQDLSMEDHETLCAEVQIMSTLVHPNVCLFMGACTQPGNIRIVTELMEGSLTDLLGAQIDEPLSVRLSWALEIAKGIEWLHKRDPPLIHMDLKPDNVLFDANYRIKVCDFGLCLYTSTKIHSDIGTPLYMAPEVLLANQMIDTYIEESADTYSFGIVLWEIVTRTKPYTEYLKSSFEDFATLVLKGERPNHPEDCPEDLFKLMEACWEPYPEDRPEFRQIIETLEYIIENETKEEQNKFIDNEIKDETARKFWKENFLGNSSVSWCQFSKALGNFLEPRISSEDMIIQCTKFVVEKNEKVSIDSFSRLCSWFGPFVRDENPPIMLYRIIETYKLPYFHGLMSGIEAENKLLHHPPGYFLVRLSTRKKGCFCISVVEKDRKVAHIMYFYDTETQQWKSPKGTFSFPTLANLITRSSKSLILNEYIHCRTYQWLFEDVGQMQSGYTNPDFEHITASSCLFD